ncbi:MAG: hypothetical protein WDM96_00080 [Lacunisphaera sp.]
MRVHQWDDATSWSEFYRLYRNADLWARPPFRTGARGCRGRHAGCLQTRGRDDPPVRVGSRARLVSRLVDEPHALAHYRQIPPPTAGPRGPDPGAGRHLDATTTINRLPDEANRQDADWELDWQRHLLDAACERLARNTKARHFQAFDLYVRQRRSALQVARELDMNVATVYLVGHRLTKELKAEVARLREQLG